MIKPYAILLFFLVLNYQSVQSQERCTDADGRELLFDWLIEKTLENESFSDIKNRRLELDFENDAEVYRQEFRDADTDQKLARVLLKLNNLRRDRHLRFDNYKSSCGITGSLTYDDSQTFAPVRFAPDFSLDKYSYFVSDHRLPTSSVINFVSIGDKLIKVNGIPIRDYIDLLDPYLRYSSENHMRWLAARYLRVKNELFGDELYRSSDKVNYTLRKSHGGEYTIRLSYGFGSNWKNHEDPGLDERDIGYRGYVPHCKFVNYANILDRPHCRLWEHNTENRIIINWMGFNIDDAATDLEEDIAALVSEAEKRNMLDWDVILWAPFCSGGSNSPKVVQILTNRYFKTTFGNIRLSDLTKSYNFSGTKIDNWVEEEAKSNADYTSNQPFKLRHAGIGENGVIPPADKSFTGNMVAVFSSLSGSNYDQFASIIIDNNLMLTLGQPTGGYSNTFEVPGRCRDDLIITCPETGEELVIWQWSVGHTIRPNGEVLEGNPAEPHFIYDLTAENHQTYWDDLLSKAETFLDSKHSTRIRFADQSDTDSDNLYLGIDKDDKDNAVTNTGNKLIVDNDHVFRSNSSSSTRVFTSLKEAQYFANSNSRIEIDSGTYNETKDGKLVLRKRMKLKVKKGPIVIK